MKHSILMMIVSFLPLALVGLFAEKNALLAQAQPGGIQAGEPMGTPPEGQPEMGQPQAGGSQMGQGQRPGASAIRGLEEFALPGGAVSEDDMSGVQTRIEQVLEKISQSAMPAGNRADNETIRSGLLAFRGWLKAQGCVADVSSTYDIDKPDAYDENIFLTHPGQIPFDVVFRMSGGAEQPYRMLLFVTTYALFDFGSLVKNNAKEDVYIPETWPGDAPGYWESRF